MAHKPGHKRFGTRGLNLVKHALKIVNPGQDASNTYSKADLERLRNKRKENDKKEKNKKENKTKINILKEKLKTKTGTDGKTKAQRMALERRKAKLEGTYKKPKTAQELAKARIKAKKEGTYKKPKTAKELAKERIRKRKEAEKNNKLKKANKNYWTTM